MRFGLVGYGLWGRCHAEAIRKAPDALLVAVACASPETAASAARDLPGVAVHRDYRALLARPDVDAVDVVVPNHLHAEVGVAALSAGKDVLLEKPMAPTVEECDRLLEAARRSGRVLSVGLELRLSRQWGRIKELIDAGDIGVPTSAVVNLFRFPYRPGAGGWRYDPERVGSWIIEELVHHYDFLMWYFERVGDPVSIAAVSSSRRGSASMADSFASVLRFAGERHAVVTKTVAGFEYHLAVEVVGTDGAIRSWWSGGLDRTRQAAYELKVLRRGAAAPEVIPIEASGELFELEEELRRIVGAFHARRPLVSGEDARKRTIVCQAALRAARDGGEVALHF
ncbi:MAG TPA: Gfo/Idh/MocA family oxidoreductase [Candidatus Methylomirabilis sp.]|nr:Gfo/Idh/MocA family oxidoreductase [Candidatus Methylomirabilis sp.]